MGFWPSALTLYSKGQPMTALRGALGCAFITGFHGKHCHGGDMGSCQGKKSGKIGGRRWILGVLQGKELVGVQGASVEVGFHSLSACAQVWLPQHSGVAGLLLSAPTLAKAPQGSASPPGTPFPQPPPPQARPRTPGSPQSQAQPQAHVTRGHSGYFFQQACGINIPNMRPAPGAERRCSPVGMGRTFGGLLWSGTAAPACHGDADGSCGVPCVPPALLLRASLPAGPGEAQQKERGPKPRLSASAGCSELSFKQNKSMALPALAAGAAGGSGAATNPLMAPPAPAEPPEQPSGRSTRCSLGLTTSPQPSPGAACASLLRLGTFPSHK